MVTPILTVKVLLKTVYKQHLVPEVPVAAVKVMKIIM